MACTERALAIVTEVLEMFQDTDSTYASINETMVKRWINQCYRKVARKGVFEKKGTYDTVADTWKYAYKSTLTDAIRIKNLEWPDARYPLKRLRSRLDFENLINLSSSGDPLYWFEDGDNLLIGPAPGSVYTLDVLYAYMPNEIECSSYNNPITPEQYDDMYVNFGLHKAFLREERDGTRQRRLSADYYALFEEDYYDCLAHYRPAGVTLRPD